MNKFNDFLNESIRDKMTAKSDEEVKIASVTTTLETYPNANKDELTKCVNLLLDNGYHYKGTNIEDHGYIDYDEDITWFTYIDPEHYISLTSNTTLSELEQRIEFNKKRYKL